MLSAEDRAKNIKLLVLDVDGVLTDGGLYYGDEGLAFKRFNVQDGLGIKMAQAAGLELAVITGLNQKPVERRITELGIRHYYPGNHDKVPLFEEVCKKAGVSEEQAAFMGDDWIDAGVMRRAGLAMSVPNAQPEIIEMAHWISRKPGGHGAVREAIAFLLKKQGRFEAIWKEWAK
ncbi:KdsC family phosphatase [Salidesulfovibrio onnuriiensis]|uniref:KdsC family phosphatase n=1 Tax=Salidesulfovibrio onnuriiensis TaxID=2583823 RepID=UPI0011CBD8A0|nr:HAD-IIIA family hydrolase [Salidesulfovibrio onnuriiensis]